jgi:RNA polymerase sigma factor (sigma-70 family)
VKESLTEFYKENYKSFLVKAKRILRDHHYAEDCVQESFERALKYLDSFQQEGNLEFWFNRVFMNTVKDYLTFIRSQGVVTELTTKDHPAFPQELVDKYKGVIEEELVVFAPSPLSFDILLAYFVQGHSAKAVSILTGCTESAVYNWSHRFRHHLEAKYKV